MRKLGCILFFIGAFLILNGCAGTRVLVAPDPEKISSGQVSTITATVTQQPAGAPSYSPAPAALVSFTPTPAVAPSPVGSNVQGVANSNFTGPVVDRDTWFTITAKYGNTTGTTQVLVRPAVGNAQFGSSTEAGDDVTVSPSVKEGPTGVWTFIYTVQEGSEAYNIRNIAVNFQKPVNLTSTAGNVSPSGGPHRNYNITASDPVQGMTGPITITVTGDVEPGGVANWDIIDTDIAHARFPTTGPK